MIAIADDGVRLVVSMRPRRRPDIIAFLSVWFSVWGAFGALSARSLIVSGLYPWWISAAWVLVMALSLGSSGLALLYYAAGRDVVIAMPGRITLREEFRGLGIGRSYDAGEVELLELEDRETLRERGLSGAAIDGNSLWLSHQGKIFPAGSGLGLEQAERLRRQILSRMMKAPARPEV